MDEDTGPAVPLDIVQVKAECLTAIVQATHRGILHTAKWLALLNTSLEVCPPLPSSADVSTSTITGTLSLVQPEHYNAEIDKYLVGKSLYDCQEYDRAAFFLDKCTFPAYRFLYFYCR